MERIHLKSLVGNTKFCATLAGELQVIMFSPLMAPLQKSDELISYLICQGI